MPGISAVVDIESEDCPTGERFKSSPSRPMFTRMLLLPVRMEHQPHKVGRRTNSRVEGYVLTPLPCSCTLVIC